MCPIRFKLNFYCTILYYWSLSTFKVFFTIVCIPLFNITVLFIFYWFFQVAREQISPPVVWQRHIIKLCFNWPSTDMWLVEYLHHYQHHWCPGSWPLSGVIPHHCSAVFCGNPTCSGLFKDIPRSETFTDVSGHVYNINGFILNQSNIKFNFLILNFKS